MGKQGIKNSTQRKIQKHQSAQAAVSFATLFRQKRIRIWHKNDPTKCISVFRKTSHTTSFN